MRPSEVVVHPPQARTARAPGRLRNNARSRSSSRSLPLNFSTQQLPQGARGLLQSLFTPTLCSHSRTRQAVNSRPASKDCQVQSAGEE